MKSLEKYLQKRLEERKEKGLLRVIKPSLKGVDFVSNDYLGTAQTPVSVSPSKSRQLRGSRNLVGSSAALTQLEEDFAHFFGTEACMVLPSGYQANLALLLTVATPKTSILFDEHVHNSLRRAIQLQQRCRSARRCEPRITPDHSLQLRWKTGHKWRIEDWTGGVRSANSLSGTSNRIPAGLRPKADTTQGRANTRANSAYQKHSRRMCHRPESQQKARGAASARYSQRPLTHPKRKKGTPSGLKETPRRQHDNRGSRAAERLKHAGWRRQRRAGPRRVADEAEPAEDRGRGVCSGIAAPPLQTECSWI